MTSFAQPVFFNRTLVKSWRRRCIESIPCNTGNTLFKMHIQAYLTVPSDRSFRAIVSSTHSIPDGTLRVVGRPAFMCSPTLHLTWNMPILTTLLAVVIALCLRGTVAVNVFLEASDAAFRSQWGANDILLTCSSGNESLTKPIHNATFTRGRVPITVSEGDDCTPSGNQYCYVQDRERLSFTANSATEGKYACIVQGQLSNELAIVGKCVH